jgi:predicted enzyme related to lactoylglutathione lyase
MTMTTIPTGRFVWFDYVCKDIARAQGFFGELFHWKTQEVPMGHGMPYTMIVLGTQAIGGYVPTPEGAPPIGHWLSHLQVADARVTCAQITSLGGKVHKAPEQMGDVGTMAIVADPGGGVFALWQPAKVEGTGDYKDAPGAWCWNELAAHDPVKSTAFYCQLGFVEQKMDMPGMGTYHVLNSDGLPRAGVMKTPMPDAPQAWMPYVQVGNVDQTVDKAKKLGAEVHMPPSTIETVGRLAIFTDPQGGWLGVLAPEKR